jgi:phosphoglycolate phosphatase-like HAD superfamily hydrolase
MIRLVLFDIDGTLIHSGGAGVMAFGKAFATAFGLREGVERMKFAGRTDTSLVREFLALNGLEATREHFDRFFQSYAFWLDHLLDRTHGAPCPGVRDLLADLQDLPQPPVLGLLTGNIRLGAEIKLRRFGLWEPFVLGGFADDSEDRNQIAAAARDRGCRWLGGPLDGPEILVVGDTPLDIRCGRAIGARVLAVATGGATREQLEAHQPDWLVDDLRQCSATDLCGRG